MISLQALHDYTKVGFSSSDVNTNYCHREQSLLYATNVVKDRNFYDMAKI